MTYRIEKVGVVGAGTMGGGIAAHLDQIFLSKNRMILRLAIAS